MRKMAIVLSAAMLMLSSAPGFSQTAEGQKDECMLASKNCINQVDDIYKRIHRLDKEIKKGKSVYSKQELQKLQQKLQETQDLLYELERNSGGN